MTAARRLTGAAGASALLTAVIAGLPWALITYAGSPIPRTVPTPMRFWWWLRAGAFDDGTVVLVLGYVLWACWLIFTVQILAQLPTVAADAVRLRRGAAVPERAARGMLAGGAVHGLLTAVLITLLAPRADAAVAGRAHASSAAASARPAVSAPHLPRCETRAHATPPAARPDAYTVVEGDSLWTIATARLGSPDRWHEVYALNAGNPQPDGRVLGDPELILPGWRLVLPAGAHSAAAVPSPLPQPAAPHPAAEPAQVTRSTAVPRPITPTAAVPAPPRTAPAAASQTAPTTVPTPQPSPAPAAPSQSAPTSADTRAAPATPRRVAPRDRVAVRLPQGGYVGIGLAAGVAAALAAARLLARSRARARFPIPLEDDPAAAAPPETAAVLERAHLLTQAPPDFGYFQDDDDDAENDGNDEDPYLADVGAEPAEPKPVRRQHTPAHALPDLAGTGRQELFSLRTAMEAPTEMHWGTGTDNAAVPLDLRTLAAGGLGLTGPGAHAAARAIVVAAAATEGVPPCGIGTVITLTPDTTAELFDTAYLPAVRRIQAADDLADALEAFEERAAERRETLRRVGLRSAADVQRFKPDYWMQPAVLLTTAPAEAEDRARLAASAAALAKLDLHVIVLGDWPEGATVRVEADGASAASTDGSAAALNGTRAFTLSAAEALEILEQLHRATPVAHPIGQPIATFETTDPAVDEPVALPTARTEAVTSNATVTERPSGPPVVVEVFNGPGVVADGCDVSVRFQGKPETILAFLALHPSGCTVPAIIDAVWEDDDDKRARHILNQNLSTIRGILRAATGQKPRMFIGDDPRTGLRRFNPGEITTDLARFTGLLDRVNKTPAAERPTLLESALALYTGPVLPGMDADWTNPTREEARRRAVDGYSELARLTGPDDPERAVHLWDTALELDPVNIELHRKVMRGYHGLGRPDAVRRTYDLLVLRMEGLDDTVDEASQALFKQLIGTKPWTPIGSNR